MPDGTTLLKFRRLLEQHKLREALFAKVGEVLQARGLEVGIGTIADATIIGAPSSTERFRNYNKSKIRARVEHVFAVVKRLWGFAKVRYRGLAKNATRSFVV